ncbi:MAG TPA: N-(5'-phosphoribosyl)anthranilate isomerase, partial [Coriobacteriia bacterium]
MPRTRIKICGLTRACDAQAAARAGADALGVILAPGHRRSITPL